MKEIKAEIVADSTNPQGDRITTYLLTFPRFILAELNTHRVFSKNSASSRAIPFKKMVEMVENDPFIPIAWQKEHKGMQGSKYEVDKGNILYLEHKWRYGLNGALDAAKRLNMSKVTKQLCNRLLEPFMWHTVLLTATEYENFFELRCPQYEFLYNDDTSPKYFRSKKELSEWYKDEFSTEENPYNSDLEWLQINKGQAEIHMMALAEAMWDAYNESTPKQLKAGEWHIPFGDKIDSLDSITDKSPIERLSKEVNHTSIAYSEDIETLAIKISTARCARLSYMTFDGEIDYEKDIKLHDTLLESRHMSPFEHCARAMSEEEYFCYHKGMVEGEFDCHLEIGSFFRILEEPKFMRDKRNGWCRNFKGFIQYRHLIENKTKL